MRLAVKSIEGVVDNRTGQPERAMSTFGGGGLGGRTHRDTCRIPMFVLALVFTLPTHIIIYLIASLLAYLLVVSCLPGR